MQTNKRSTTARDDIRVLNATLRKLLLPTRLIQVGVIAGVVIVWVWIAQQILRLGGLIRYDGLKSLGPEFVRIMTSINPYLWWGVVAILSLIVLSVTRTWLINSQKRSRSVLVSVAEVQKLATTLSTEGVQVLRWVWDEAADPVSAGDLIETRQQLNAGRIRKLAMAQAQAQALKSADTPAAFNVRDIRPEPAIDPQTTAKLSETPERVVHSRKPEFAKRQEPTL